jgi:hypothetical protein
MAQPSFQITVPVPPAGKLAIMEVAVVVILEKPPAAPGVTFRVTNPNGDAHNIGPLKPGDPQPPEFLFPIPAGAPAAFGLFAWAPPLTDPVPTRYVLTLDLRQDYDLNANCAAHITANETWTIAVVGGGANFADAALVSFCADKPGLECVGGLQPVKDPARAAQIVGFPGRSDTPRPGVDAIFVLDKSGSMAGSAATGSPISRMDSLHKAVSDFALVWSALRAHETDPSLSISAPQDNIAVALFDSGPSWWTAPPLTSALVPFNDTTAATMEDPVALNLISPGGSTSPGPALINAATDLGSADPTRRRVIVLMTDGHQNSGLNVGLDNSGKLATYPFNDPSSTTPVPNQDKFVVFAVTVGPASDTDPYVCQSAAQATNGFYNAVEDNADKLEPLFLQLLQNFVHFASWETLRLVQETLTEQAPSYSFNFPTTSTTTHVAITLRSRSPRVSLRLRVTPAGEAIPTVAQTGSGPALLQFDIPTSPAYDDRQDWAVVVDVAPVVDVASEFGLRAAAAGDGSVVFDLVVIADDLGVHTELAIQRGNHAPGEPITLVATLSERARPILGVGSQAGDQIVAQVVQPGQGLGDLLSSSSASSAQPFPSDPGSAAQAKLYNMVQSSPVQRTSGGLITLRGDGAGTYTGTFTAQTPGHYDFLFGVGGNTVRAGRFSRQALKTIYVRPLPDGGATQIQSSTAAIGGGSQLTVNFTPQTRFRNRLGPGWGNHFWFTSPGITPFKPTDNLDGTYRATLLYSGFTPPPLTLHFVDVPMTISDAVPPDKLPVPLGAGTVLVPFVNPTGFLSSLPLLFWLFLLIAFLVGLVIGLLI